MVMIYNLLLSGAVLLGLPLLLGMLLMPRRRGMFFYRLGVRRDHLAFGERLKQKKKAIWIHALSVGEVLSAEPVVCLLLEHEPDVPIVFSATTGSGMRTARQLFEGKVTAVINFPYDLLFSVRRVIRMVNPTLVVIVETDLWPNFLWQLERWHIPALLVNARLSDSSFRGYKRLGRLMSQALATLDGIGAQTRPDAERFVKLGAPAGTVTVTGNVKFDQAIPENGDEAGRVLRASMGIVPERIVVVMGSTHSGEELAGIQLLESVKEKSLHILLIIAPRDPAKAEKVAERFSEAGLRVGFLDELAYKDACRACDVLVVNTIGLLRRLYDLADIAFVGGSLVPEGGHNPLEPAAAGCPILFGPDMSDFMEVAERLTAAGAAICVQDNEAFCRETKRLTGDLSLRQAMGCRGRRVFIDNRGASRRIVEMIHDTLERCREKNDRVSL